MTDAPAPRQDLAALAKDVDRLFRARQDGRQMPVGERFESSLGVMWKPAPEEWRANVMARSGLDAEVGDPRPLKSGDKSYFRAVSHVAILALTAPDFFRGCLAVVDETWDGLIPGTYEDAKGNFRPVIHSTPADVARTHRYLVDLDRRLRDWREAGARRQAVATADAQAAERDRKARDEAADHADEMAAAERDGDLACFEEAT